MKRLISSLAISATLAASAFALAGASSFVAKEGELREGGDDAPKIETEVVGREGELRNGADNAPEIEIENVGREDEPRDGEDDAANHG